MASYSPELRQRPEREAMRLTSVRPQAYAQENDLTPQRKYTYDKAVKRNDFDGAAHFWSSLLMSLC